MPQLDFLKQILKIGESYNLLKLLFYIGEWQMKVQEKRNKFIKQIQQSLKKPFLHSRYWSQVPNINLHGLVNRPIKLPLSRSPSKRQNLKRSKKKTQLQSLKSPHKQCINTISFRSQELKKKDETYLTKHPSTMTARVGFLRKASKDFSEEQTFLTPRMSLSLNKSKRCLHYMMALQQTSQVQSFLCRHQQKKAKLELRSPLAYCQKREDAAGDRPQASTKRGELSPWFIEQGEGIWELWNKQAPRVGASLSYH